MSDIFDLDLFPCMAGFTPDFAQTTQIFLSVRDEPSSISSPGPWFPFQPHVEFRKLASGTFCSDSIYASAPKQSTTGFPVLSIPSCHLFLSSVNQQMSLKIRGTSLHHVYLPRVGLRERTVLSYATCTCYMHCVLGENGCDLPSVMGDAGSTVYPILT